MAGALTWEEVAATLRARRDEAGMSNRKIAQAIERDRKQIDRWLDASREPEATNMLALLEALGVALEPSILGRPRAVNAELAEVRLELLALRTQLAPASRGGSTASSLLEELLTLLERDADALDEAHLEAVADALRQAGAACLALADRLSDRRERAFGR